MGLGGIPIARAATQTPEARLRRKLRDLRWPAELARTRGCAYRGPADFVLRHGQQYVPTDTPEFIGAPKKCFGNAIALAAIHGFRYVEGYAVDPGRAQAAIHHAWNVTAEGLVIDSTWANTGVVYLGVEFAVGRADDATWNGDATVLDDHNRGWPLLREPWEGEDDGREWEPSEAIAAVYRYRMDDLIAGTGPFA